MKNLLTVLKKLGKKMTGSDIAGTNLVTVVDDIANKYTCGSGGGGDCDCTLVVGVTMVENEPTLDKTWQEIYDALVAGKQVVELTVNENGVTQFRIIQAFNNGLNDSSFFVEVDNGNLFKVDTATGYPVYYEEADNPIIS